MLGVLLAVSAGAKALSGISANRRNAEALRDQAERLAIQAQNIDIERGHRVSELNERADYGRGSIQARTANIGLAQSSATPLLGKLVAQKTRDLSRMNASFNYKLEEIERKRVSALDKADDLTSLTTTLGTIGGAALDAVTKHYLYASSPAAAVSSAPLSGGTDLYQQFLKSPDIYGATTPFMRLP